VPTPEQNGALRRNDGQEYEKKMLTNISKRGKGAKFKTLWKARDDGNNCEQRKEGKSKRGIK
jgi:hypothetical protein